MAVAVGLGRLVRRRCSRQTGPPRENVAAAVWRRCSRTWRREPVGALRNLLLNVTAITCGRPVPRFRAIVMMPDFGSTRSSPDRALLITRATWRALQHPLSSTWAACSLRGASKPARDHTNVADAAGGMGDVKVGTARQAGPPTGRVVMAWRAPLCRSTRCAPVGALGNRVLKRTVMLSGQTTLWRRSTVIAPVCASTRARGREVVVMRAICRAAQQPDRCTIVMCCAAPVDRPRTVHTKVVAAAGGRGDCRTATRACGAAGAARTPASPPTSGGSTSIISSPPDTAECRGLPPGRAAARWAPRARLTRAMLATWAGRRHDETQGQRIMLFWTWPWRTRGLLAWAW
jgi:hypothetical protein